MTVWFIDCNERGVVGHIINSDVGMAETKFLGFLGTLQRTRRKLKARFLDFICRFPTNVYWHDLLPHHSTTNRLKLQPYTKGPSLLLCKGITTTYTRNL
jgi:hypothetical protein